ncbi:MAG: osmoprotectant transport system substrate-binding protein [Micromonosporaceae bacterium]|jgi:osmoprotectant transport system substrate-binding protein|nr:osmoprotectant transport system substrate-binding protein [Micromonosporaceae bacterium]MDT5035870.1 osmoprotectant transport system substrate-binding protein [Micromonosporaceae bacterium]
MVRAIRGAAAVLLALVLLPACGGGGSGSAKKVVVGSANFPENQLLAEMYAQALEAKGITVDRKFNIGAREVTFKQISSGGLSVLPEYNGALLAYLDKASTATSTADVNAAVKAKLPTSLTILDSAQAEDKDSLNVTKATADKYSLKTIDDLRPVAGQLIVGGPPEFKTRQQGIVGLKSQYGLEFKEFRSLDTAGPVTVAALQKGDIQVANLFTTDPAIVVNGFVVLDDTKNLFSSQNVTPLINKAAVDATAQGALNAVSAKLDTTTLTQLMRKLAVDKQDPDKVAKDWLKSAGLV